MEKERGIRLGMPANTRTKGLGIFVKKTIAIVCAVLLTAALAAGCTQRKDTNTTTPGSQASSSEASSEVVGKAPEDMTEEEIAENNAELKEENVQLIQFEEIKAGDEIAVIATSMGEVRIKLFREQAPKTVENFVKLAEEGYYNGVTFHRVINGFMIQGGDPTATGRGGHSIYTNDRGDFVPFEDEFSTDLWNFRGALSMANAGPNTNGSQFFIVQSKEIQGATAAELQKYQFPANVVEKYSENGGTPGLDWKHTVFGQVISGMDIVDKIAAVKTNDADKPVDAVIVESIVIEIEE